MVKLQITKYEDNVRYEAELDAYKERNKYRNNSFEDSNYPQRETAKNIMEVFITEEQFVAIRKAVLEVF